MTRRLVLLAALVAAVAGCGGSGSSSSSGGSQADSSSSLVTKVDHAKAEVVGQSVVGSVRVTEGGEPGQRLSLRYGLVDAVSGVRASQEEKLVATYTTTPSVATKDVSIRFPKPSPTDYLVHFVLYGPDGSYLASSDSPVFSVR